MTMIVIFALVFVAVVWEVRGYPSGYYPYYGGTVDSLAYGASGSSHGAMLMNRYYQPYYPRGLGGGTAAFMFQPTQQQPSQGYYQSDKRREPTYTPPQPPQQIPQQNEVYYPQAPEDSYTTKITEADPTTEKFELSTTVRTVIPELIEPEVEEVEEQKPRKRVSKKKQVKRPVEDEEEDDLSLKMPGGMFFPMYFGWGGRAQGGGGAGGVMAIANAYSNGRGGVSSSHATAYGTPREEPVKL